MFPCNIAVLIVFFVFKMLKNAGEFDETNLMEV